MGLDKNFVINQDKLDACLICPLCQKLCINPIQCGRCQNHFCAFCLDQFWKKNAPPIHSATGSYQICPIDKENMAKISPS